MEILWRLARSCSDTLEAASDASAKKRLAFEGLEYAREALEADENSAAAHKWMSIMTR